MMTIMRVAAPGEGRTVGDVYGDVTHIGPHAASDSNSTYTLKGSSPVDADGQTYEAEYASPLLQTRRPL